MWSLAQLEQVLLALHVAAVCPAPVIWHLKHRFGSSSSFLTSCCVPSIRIPCLIRLFASHLDFMVGTACDSIWFVSQLLGFLNHFALTMAPWGILFSSLVTVVISSRRFHSAVDKNCTTTWYVFPLIVTFPGKHHSKCLDISSCFSHSAPFSVTIFSSTPPFLRIRAATNFALSGFLLSFSNLRLAL